MADDLRATINSVEYAVDSWETVQNEELLRKVWKRGFTGGMGKYLDDGSDESYYFASNMDMSTAPYMRMRPAAESAGAAVHGSLTNLDGTYPMFPFIASETATPTTKYFYVLNGRYGYKFSSDGLTLHSTKDFGANAICGHPIFFEGKWYIPLGTDVDWVQLTTIAAGAVADTYTSATTLTANVTRALHFAGPTIVEKVAQIALARGAAGFKHVLDLSADAVIFAGSYEIGDSGIPISDILTMENQYAVIKPDNLYATDTDGNAFAIQNFISSPQVTAYDGSNACSFGQFIYWPVAGRLWLMTLNGSGAPVDPTADPNWYSRTNVDGTIDPLQGTLNTASAAAAFGKYLYWVSGRQLMHGVIQQGGDVLWHGSIYDFSASANSGNRLGIVSGTALTATPYLIVMDTGADTLSFLSLQKDGSPRYNGVHGAASITGRAILPNIDFGPDKSDKMKQWRRMWIKGEDLDKTGVSTQLGAIMDRGDTVVSVGAAITTDGYIERAWTPGTSDTAREVMPVATITLGAGYTVNGDPSISEIGIEAACFEIVRVVIRVTVEGQNDLGGNITTIAQALKNLKNGTHVTVLDPYATKYTLDSWSGQIINRQEQFTPGNGGNGSGMIVTLMIERSTYGS